MFNRIARYFAPKPAEPELINGHTREAWRKRCEEQAAEMARDSRKVDEGTMSMQEFDEKW